MTTVEDVPATQVVQSYYDKLFQDGFLVNLHIRIWGMGVSLNEEDLDIEEKLPKIIKLGKKMLIKPEVLNKFKNLEGKARRYLYKSSFPFPIADAHFVPKKKLGDVILELDKYKTDFYRLAEEFFHHYEEHKQEVLDSYPEYREVLTPLYPPVDELRGKFSFNKSIFEIAMPQDLTEIDIRELMDRERATTEVKEQIEGEMRAQYEQSMRQLEQFGAEAASALRAQVMDVCETLIGKISKKELISKSNLNSVKDMIKDFQDLNFMDDKAVSSELQKLQTILEHGHNFKTDEAALQTLNIALTSVVTEAKNLADVRYLGGEYFRPLKI